MKFLRNKKGFSLVELLVVITIIAILSVAAFTAISGNTVKARDAKRQQDLAAIQAGLEFYFVEYDRYPALLENGLADSDGGDAGLAFDWMIPRIYLSTIPTDPSDKTQAYSYWSDGDTYIIGAVLENDGDPIAYVVGNHDLPVGGIGYDLNAIGPGSSCPGEVGNPDCYPYDVP